MSSCTAHNWHSSHGKACPFCELDRLKLELSEIRYLAEDSDPTEETLQAIAEAAHTALTGEA